MALALPLPGGARMGLEDDAARYRGKIIVEERYDPELPQALVNQNWRASQTAHIDAQLRPNPYWPVGAPSAFNIEKGDLCFCVKSSSPADMFAVLGGLPNVQSNFGGWKLTDDITFVGVAKNYLTIGKPTNNNFAVQMHGTNQIIWYGETPVPPHTVFYWDYPMVQRAGSGAMVPRTMKRDDRAPRTDFFPCSLRAFSAQGCLQVFSKIKLAFAKEYETVTGEAFLPRDNPIEVKDALQQDRFRQLAKKLCRRYTPFGCLTEEHGARDHRRIAERCPIRRYVHFQLELYGIHNSEWRRHGATFTGMTQGEIDRHHGDTHTLTRSAVPGMRTADAAPIKALAHYDIVAMECLATYTEIIRGRVVGKTLGPALPGKPVDVMIKPTYC